MRAPRRRRHRWALAALLCAIQGGSAGFAEAQARGAAVKPKARQTVSAPLPPRRPAELTPRPPTVEPSKPAPAAESSAAAAACLTSFAERGGVVSTTAPEAGSGECAIANPVTFRAIAMPDGSKVELDSALTVSCAFALEVLEWVRGDLSALAARENGKLAGLTGVGGHACRPRNGVSGAPISEHATGNALDLGGLRLQGGKAISLTDKDVSTRPLREALQKSACARFTTVLGPGSDSSHKDHLHLDMRRRPRDFRICQWDVE